MAPLSRLQLVEEKARDDDDGLEILKPAVAPSLRQDLLSDRIGEKVQITDPQTQRTFELYDTEWSVASLFDGNRTFSEIAQEAAKLGLSPNPEMVRSFARELKGYGFLNSESIGSIDAPVDPDPVSDEERQLVSMAQSMASRGEVAAAQGYLRAALQINPSNTNAETMLQGLETQPTESALPVVAEGTSPPGFVEHSLPEEALLAPPPVLDAEEDEDIEELERLVIAEQRRERRKKHIQALTWIVGTLSAVALVTSFIPWRESIVISARIESADARIIRASSTARIVKVLVDSGDRVQEGDVLFMISHEELDTSLSETRARLEQAEAELERLENGYTELELAKSEKNVASKRSNLSFALREFRRVRRAGDVVTETEKENARRSVAVRRNELRQAQMEHKLMKAGNRDELIRVQRSRVAEVASRKKYLEQEIGRSAIRSPIDGVVIVQNIKELEGTIVQTGERLLQIRENREVTLVIDVPDSDIADVAKGAKVEFWAHAFPTRRFYSEVSFVSGFASADPESELTGAYFRCEAELSNEELVLRPGMEGRATIVVGEASMLYVTFRPIIRGLTRVF